MYETRSLNIARSNMSVSKNISALLENIAELARLAGRNPQEISLVGVTKGESIEQMEKAYWSGLHDFAESRVQEALLKMPLLPSDVRWHYIGKLQKNKVNKVVGRFVLIHSVDSFELAEKISQTSLQMGIISNVLLEANTSGEETKGGLSPDDWEECFLELLTLKGIEVQGLMTMAPLTEDEGIIRHTFSELRLLKERLQDLGRNRVQLTELSMGMSHDYPLAIQEGATLLRIGGAIFKPT